MIQIIRRAFVELVTLDDNTTHDLARWLALGAVMFFCIMTAWDCMWRGGEWKPIDFGAGLGAVFVASGSWIWMEKKSNKAGE